MGWQARKWAGNTGKGGSEARIAALDILDLLSLRARRESRELCVERESVVGVR